MKNQKYTNATYSVAIALDKSPSDVFRHLIDLAGWWPEEFQGPELKRDAVFTLKAGEGHFSKNKVIEYVPNRKLTWIVTESLRKADNFDWSGSKFIFDLIPQGTGTQLTFTYDGIVFEHEYDVLVKVCDRCIKEMFLDFITTGKTKRSGNSFTATTELSKSPHEVFNCITEVINWWSKDFEGRSSNLNDEFTIHHPGQHYSRQKLVEVVPGKKMVWQVTESTLHWLAHDKHEWTGTRMIFEITSAGDKTSVHFTHEGLTPDKECYANCQKGWNMIIGDWLPHFVAHGTSSPEMSKISEIRRQMLAKT